MLKKFCVFYIIATLFLVGCSRQSGNSTEKMETTEQETIEQLTETSMESSVNIIETSEILETIMYNGGKYEVVTDMDYFTVWNNGEAKLLENVWPGRKTVEVISGKATFKAVMFNDWLIFDVYKRFRFCNVEGEFRITPNAQNLYAFNFYAWDLTGDGCEELLWSWTDTGTGEADSGVFIVDLMSRSQILPSIDNEVCNELIKKYLDYLANYIISGGNHIIVDSDTHEIFLEKILYDRDKLYDDQYIQKTSGKAVLGLKYDVEQASLILDGTVNIELY